MKVASRLAVRACGIAGSVLVMLLAGLLGRSRHRSPHGPTVDYSPVGGRADEIRIQRDIEGRNPQPRDPAP